MQSINGLLLAPDVKTWLANTRHPRVLHVFERVCNLISEHGEVLSIVSPKTGVGPFNLVVEEEVLFSENITLQSPVSHSSHSLTLGHLVIHTANAKIWKPCPDWQGLHAQRNDIVQQLIELPITQYLNPAGLDTPFVHPLAPYARTGVPWRAVPGKNAQGYSTSANIQSLVSNLSLALVNADLPSAQKISSQLAGLGIGLTPAGDDFILGALYAAWIIHPPGVAGVLAQGIANTVAPLTTSLSAAWLRSGGRGEAGIFWHEFFEALVSADHSRIRETLKNILSVGETSGADALAGFLQLFHDWGEHCSSL